MIDSIHTYNTGPWLNNLYQQNEREATSDPPLFLPSVLPEEDELMDEDGDSEMFGTFLVDGFKDEHRCQTCESFFLSFCSLSTRTKGRTLSLPFPLHFVTSLILPSLSLSRITDSFSSATPSYPRSSPSLTFMSPRPSSSSSSCSSSLGYSSYSSCTPFNHLPSPIPEHEEAFSSWSPTSPTSPTFSTSRDQDPFGLASLLALGRVDDDRIAGGFEQDQQHDLKDDLVEADRLQWNETAKTLEDAIRRREQEPQRPRSTRPPPSPTPPTVFAPPLTSDHSNPYHELGRHLLQAKSPFSASSSATSLVLNHPARPSLPFNLKRTSQSVSLRESRIKPFTSLSPKARPRSSSCGVTPTFLEPTLGASSTSFASTQKEKEEEDFATALARLRREKGEMKYGFPRLRWLDEGGGE